MLLLPTCNIRYNAGLGRRKSSENVHKDLHFLYFCLLSLRHRLRDLEPQRTTKDDAVSHDRCFIARFWEYVVAELYGAEVAGGDYYEVLEILVVHDAEMVS